MLFVDPSSRVESFAHTQNKETYSWGNAFPNMSGNGITLWSAFPYLSCEAFYHKQGQITRCAEQAESISMNSFSKCF